MDPTEESFVPQVREAYVAQVTHVNPFCFTQLASRGARRREKIAIVMELRICDSDFGINVL